ncbi:MAG: cation diffusion facilitator family transporter [Pseudomonadota bacterium]
MQTEKGALRLSATAALLVGTIAIGFSFATDSQAILLDGLFNVTYFLTALLTLKVAELVAKPDDEEYPFGYAYFEPLINGVKGVLLLGISMLALLDSVDALFEGGRMIVVGPAIGYGVFATAVCTTAAVLLHRAHRKTGSPLVGADAANWMVNGAISGAVLLTFATIPLVEAAGWSAVTPYVDPLAVTIVVLISLGVPIRIAWDALKAMLNRAPPATFRTPVVVTIEAALADLPAERVFVRMLRPGRTLYVVVHVVLPETWTVGGLTTLDTVRARVDAAVQERHGPAVVDVVFTADARWAAPAAPGMAARRDD